MGAVQATSLLVKTDCDILIHINSHVPTQVPSYGRIKGFCDTCEQYNIPNELILSDLGNTYAETTQQIDKIAYEAMELLVSQMNEQKSGSQNHRPILPTKWLHRF